MFKKVLFVSVIFLFLGITVFLGMADKPLPDAVAQLEQAGINSLRKRLYYLLVYCCWLSV